MRFGFPDFSEWDTDGLLMRPSCRVRGGVCVGGVGAKGVLVYSRSARVVRRRAGWTAHAWCHISAVPTEVVLGMGQVGAVV